MATYSILAVDDSAGLIGLAVQSHYFAVGSMAIWAEPGVGGVVIQSIPSIAYDYAVDGLNRMREGASAGEALDAIVAKDERSEYRQAAMVDVRGAPVAFTGERCVEYAGHTARAAVSCHANMAATDGLWEAMADAYESSGEDLPGRLLDALGAAERAGGDLRGKQSAALIVVRRDPVGHHLEDRPFDLRVEDHPEPLFELDRLVRLKRAYHHSTRGDAALVRGESDEALDQYRLSERTAPRQTELHFWRAVALLNEGVEREAMQLLKGLVRSDPKWLELLGRVERAGLVEMGERQKNELDGN